MKTDSVKVQRSYLLKTKGWKSGEKKKKIVNYLRKM